jgi:hypothetical protein
MAIKVTGKANTTKLRSKLQNMSKQVHRTAADVLESEGRICAVSLAKSTQPFGTGADAKDMGERAVARDIARVYATIGDVFGKLPTVGQGDARQFWKLIQLGKFDAAQQILTRFGSRFASIKIGPFDAGALHHQARNARTGRVSQTMPSLVVTNGRALQTYAQSKINLVGFGKSAWANIAKQLGGVRGLRAPKLAGGERDVTANWITRKGATGSIHRTGWDTARPRLTLTSNVRYADNILSQSAMRNAIRIARERIIKQIQMAAAFEMRRARAA